MEKKKGYIGLDTIFVTIIYLVFAAATIFSNTLLYLAGCLMLFAAVAIANIDVSLRIAICMMPNAAIVTYTSGGIGLMIVVYLILFMRLFTVGRLNIRRSLLVPFCCAILLALAGSRIFKGNMYDILLVIQQMIALLVWGAIIDKNIMPNEEIYYSFRYGCLLTMMGMVLGGAILSPDSTRLVALQDDANYTACILFVLFIASLLVYAYKMNIRNNWLYMFLSLGFGLLTGSRGFLVAVGVAVIVFCFMGVVSPKIMKIIGLGLCGIAVFAVMYLMNIGFIVEVYDNTIGRTLELLDSSAEGQFMDISSGRIFLWNHYWDMIKDDNIVLLFGKGFEDYHLTENGGYFNMLAHNAYLASVIGLGFIGTIALLIVYFQFLKQRNFFTGDKAGRAFGAIVLGLAAEMMFLDGILDMRIACFLGVTVALQQLWKLKESELSLSTANR